MPSTEHERRDALPAGTALRDFTIRSVIGHGGFGIVYRAEHNELDLTVAIKEYLPVELAMREGATVQPRSGTDRPGFEDGLRRFRDEAQALIEFDSHPSIVSCRDFFRANGTAYLVMDHEDGLSLAEVLASREAEGRPFTESDLLAVMVPVLEGLAHVHQAGVLHRDIKPSNILIRRRDERPVLIDFGAAKQAAARFSKSQAPYTEGYAALEQVADTGKLGPWTDMYGAGAVMWRMVAGGNRPWEPPHPLRVELRSHAALGEAEDPLPSASGLGQGRFPPKMLEAIDRCLRLREKERTQNSRELLEALRAAGDQSAPAVSAEGERPSAEQVVAVRHEGRSRAAPTVPEPRTDRRRAQRLALVGLAFGLGLGFVLSTWWSPGSEETRRQPGESWTNSLGMEFVWVPAGRFLMGSPEGEAGRESDETRHEVRISRGFWMGKYEVTQGEWEAVRGTNPSYFAECGPRCPVESVSWEDTQEFIRRLHGRESGNGYEYRLPTEAEWEYAARAGTGGATPAGDLRILGERNAPVLDGQGWYGGNSGVAYAGGYDCSGREERQYASERCGTHAVGLKGANGRGLHDMLGNVWEWTGDWYGEYPLGAVTDPQGPGTGSAPGGSGRRLVLLRVVRSVCESRPQRSGLPQPQPRLPLGQDGVTLGAFTLSPSAVHWATACVGQRRRERQRPSRAAGRTPGAAGSASGPRVIGGMQPTAGGIMNAETSLDAIKRMGGASR